MIEFQKNNKKLIDRSLVEQVGYLSDLHSVEKTLASWGITVIGQVETVDDLTPANSYDGKYGDAYAVGTEAPFDFYIWTRSSVDNQGYWFPFGQISIAGPEGPKGDKGDKGDTGASTRWYIRSTVPGSSEYNFGDILLQVPIGNVYQVMDNPNGKEWTYMGNIRGPQGIDGKTGPTPTISSNGAYITSSDPQTGKTYNIVPLSELKGDKGDTGDVGGFINIYGIVENTKQLPENPEELHNRSIAYLLGTDFPYNLYIQVGDADGPIDWVDTGPLNVSTLVMVNGEYQNVWNANTKVDKVTTATSNNQAYVKLANGNQTMWNMENGPVPATICVRDGEGRLRIAAPVNSGDCANKGYVDSNTTIWYKHSFPATRLSDSKKVYISFYSTSATPHIVTNEYGEITLDNNIPGVNYRVSFIQGQEGFSVLVSHSTHTEFAYITYTNTNRSTAIYTEFTSLSDPNYTVTKL